MADPTLGRRCGDYAFFQKQLKTPARDAAKTNARPGGVDVREHALRLRAVSDTHPMTWTPPVGHADIAPSNFERIEGDGYLTLDAHWVVPALLRSVPVAGRVTEPAADRGHISRDLKRAGLDVTSFDIRRYEDSLVDDIAIGDIRTLGSLARFDWTITNLPYSDLGELAEILTRLGARDGCKRRCSCARNNSSRRRITAWSTAIRGSPAPSC